MEKLKMYFLLFRAMLFYQSSLYQLMVNIVGLGPGGLDSWDPVMKGIVT